MYGPGFAAHDQAFSILVIAMKKHVLLACASVVLATTSSWTAAQTTLTPQTAAAIASHAAPLSQPALEVRQGSSGASFLSGGAGNEERQKMAAQRSQFPLKVVLSAGSGEYIVADKLILGNKGQTLIDVADVGPWVMINAPAGSYTLAVTYQGKTRSQVVKLGKASSQINLRFPG